MRLTYNKQIYYRITHGGGCSSSRSIQKLMRKEAYMVCDKMRLANAQNSISCCYFAGHLVLLHQIKAMR